MKFIVNLEKSLQENAFLKAFHINNVDYTYANLSAEVNKIRLGIRTKIPVENKLIGLVTNDDLQTYASIIALWLEGKAYVPVNPIYPIERNLGILEAVETCYVLDSSESSVYSIYHKVIHTSKLKKTVKKEPRVEVDKNDIAYILFTSGSTGKPKGVPINFGNLDALVDALDAEEEFQLEKTDKCLQMFELSFDFSVVAYLPPLLAGAALFTIPKDQIKYFYIYKLMVTKKLTVLTMVPSIIHYLRPYIHEISAQWVKYCSFGGGKLMKDVAAEWSSCIPNAKIFNYYGPTEFTVYSGYYPYKYNTQTKNHNGIIGIGKPQKGVTYIVVDEENKIVESGVTGELCLAGEQITEGYWKNSKLNSKAFCNKKINGETKRFYKTGDLCFVDDDGDYMYVGRLDFQVKIGGYRVELGEIECIAKETLTRTDLVALDFTNKYGNKEIAMVVISDPVDTDGLVANLKVALPTYMIPTKFLFLKEFPHSVNGKIDRKELRRIIEK